MKYRRPSIVLTNVLLMLVLFFGAESAFAGHTQDTSDMEPASAKKLRSRFSLEISTGYRIDQLDWSIAGFLSPRNFVNILSELTWEDLIIKQYKIGGRLVIPLHNKPHTIYVRGSLSYGEIVDGENQDSDYAGNNRTREFSRSNNDADHGAVRDLSIGAGFQSKRQLEKSNWTLWITPLIGYSHHQQDLKMTNGFQTVSRPDLTPPSVVPLPLGPFAGPPPLFEPLNSTYDTDWFGPWLGLDLAVDDGKKTTFFGSLEYHWDITYRAEANWNLRPDFAHPVSFKHEADGSGLVVTAGWAYLIRSKVSINTTLEYQRWTTKRGVDTIFFSDGTAGATSLNEVNWESRSLSLSLQYRFE